MYLSPGFIDIHSHADGGMIFPENRPALNYLKQGRDLHGGWAVRRECLVDF